MEVMVVSKSKNGNVLITINGVTKNITQWAKEYGINPKTLSQRIAKGCDESHIIKFDKYLMLRKGCELGEV